ncbi:hypothetical protein KXW70_006889 [Aspergillus fumigatus]|nr:hypothetical protein KXW70_006889 [Aspergillus fumigatus]
MPHVLIILTSQGLIPATRQQTGWHLSELAHPYSILEPKVTLTMASPQGGEAPFDPASASASAKPESDTTDITALARHWEAWTHTYKIRELVARAGAGDDVDAAGKPIAAVSHGPAALLNATAPSGVSLLAGAGVTGFSREEEDAAGMAPALPFQLETELERVSGGGYVKADRSGTKVVVSTTAGLCSPLITGQNPASAAGVAREILRVLGCD